MRPVLSAAAIVGALLGAVPAAAQSLLAPKAPSSSAGRWFVGGMAGGGSVHSAAGLFGGQLGFRLTDRIDIFGEGVGMKNIVTRQRLGLARSVGTFLQTSQGSTASGNIEAPAFYAGGGVHIMLTTERHVRPFVTVGAGMARVALKPVFTLGGADVTASLTQYGVTLGRDLTGNLTKPAFDGGVGARILQGRWYIDGEVRVTNIRTADRATNVLRTTVGFGLRF